MDQQLAGLAHEIEASFSLDTDLVTRVQSVLKDVSSQPPGDFESTDDVMRMVNELRPGWYLRMHGSALLPNGHWHCTLRESDVRDNDAYIGIGNGPTLSHALLAALLKALAFSR